MKFALTLDAARYIVGGYYNDPQHPKEPVRFYRYAADRLQRYTHRMEQIADALQMQRTDIVRYCDRQTDPMPHCVVKAADETGVSGRYFDPREVEAWVNRQLS